MSGHELKDEQIGTVRALTAEQRTRAAVRVAQAAVKAKPAKGTKKKRYTRDDIVDFLEMLGLVDYSSPAAVDPNGQTVYVPDAASKAKAAARKREWRQGREEDTS